jgi:hypothetical protein
MVINRVSRCLEAIQSDAIAVSENVDQVEVVLRMLWRRMLPPHVKHLNGCLTYLNRRRAVHLKCRKYSRRNVR